MFVTILQCDRNCGYIMLIFRNNYFQVNNNKNYVLNHTTLPFTMLHSMLNYINSFFLLFHNNILLLIDSIIYWKRQTSKIRNNAFFIEILISFQYDIIPYRIVQMLLFMCNELNKISIIIRMYVCIKNDLSQTFQQTLYIILEYYSSESLFHYL